jgi:hypothetical protein
VAGPIIAYPFSSDLSLWPNHRPTIINCREPDLSDLREECGSPEFAQSAVAQTSAGDRKPTHQGRKATVQVRKARKRYFDNENKHRTGTTSKRAQKPRSSPKSGTTDFETKH